ncbi:hypothetical protein GGF32_002407 [Allomyces javanicus]|nr:hypothetical protein GGF32_002407 [Allomyces javanicus]
MPVSVYIGLFTAADDKLVWTFTSQLQAAKCFGYKAVQPTMTKPLNKGDGKYTKAGHEKYYLKLITKEQLSDCKIDSSKLERVRELVQGNTDWDLEITETVQECQKCKVVKPWTNEFFSVESYGLRKTCRECRNNHVRERAETKMLEVEEEKNNGTSTFKCPGYALFHNGLFAATDNKLVWAFTLRL